MAHLGCLRRWVFLGILTVALMSGANESQGAWVTYQSDAAHTGYVPGRYHFRRAKLRWQTTVASNSPNGLAVGDGAVFVSLPFPIGVPYPPPPSVRALDQATGAILWSESFSVFSVSPPACSNGIVYFQTDDHSDGGGNFLHAYEARSGTPIFAAPYDAQYE